MLFISTKHIVVIALGTAAFATAEKSHAGKRDETMVKKNIFVPRRLGSPPRHLKAGKAGKGDKTGKARKGTPALEEETTKSCKGSACAPSDSSAPSDVPPSSPVVPPPCGWTEGQANMWIIAFDTYCFEFYEGYCGERGDNAADQCACASIEGCGEQPCGMTVKQSNYAGENSKRCVDLVSFSSWTPEECEEAFADRPECRDYDYFLEVLAGTAFEPPVPPCGWTEDLANQEFEFSSLDFETCGDFIASCQANSANSGDTIESCCLRAKGCNSL